MTPAAAIAGVVGAGVVGRVVGDRAMPIKIAANVAGAAGGALVMGAGIRAALIFAGVYTVATIATAGVVGSVVAGGSSPGAAVAMLVGANVASGYIAYRVAA